MEVALLALLVTMVSMLSTFNPRMDYGTILGHCSGLLTFDTSILYNASWNQYILLSDGCSLFAASMT